MRRLPLMTPSIARGAELAAKEASPVHSAALLKTCSGLAAPGGAPAMGLLQSQGLYPLGLYSLSWEESRHRSMYASRPIGPRQMSPNQGRTPPLSGRATVLGLSAPATDKRLSARATAVRA